MSNDIEKRLKGEQVHKTGPRGEALFCMTNVYQFILAVAAAAAFGDSWSGSSGCTGVGRPPHPGLPQVASLKPSQ